MSDDEEENFSGEEENVRLVIRCRPLSDLEQTLQNACVINTTEADKKVVQVTLSERNATSFRCNRYFDYSTNQAQFFDKSGVKNLITKAVEGFSVTMFAYGQTGAGKTHTMVGGGNTEGGKASTIQTNDGIIPRRYLPGTGCVCGDAYRPYSVHPAVCARVLACSLTVPSPPAATIATAVTVRAPVTVRPRPATRTHPRPASVPPASSAHFIFKLIKQGYQGIDFVVKASCIEIYNNQVRDLLSSAVGDSNGFGYGGGGSSASDSRAILHVRESPKGFYVENMSIAVCESAKTLHRIMTKVFENRKVANTRYNSLSSRSHCILNIYVESTPAEAHTAPKKYGKISMVDLAGSERLKDNEQADTGTRKETGHINRSLYVLGKVIAAMNSRAVSKRVVPFRDSALTKLLMDSLGGHSSSLMIACCSPASSQVCGCETRRPMWRPCWLCVSGLSRVCVRPTTCQLFRAYTIREGLVPAELARVGRRRRSSPRVGYWPDRVAEQRAALEARSSV
jgi:hypothetical protein